MCAARGAHRAPAKVNADVRQYDEQGDGEDNVERQADEEGDADPDACTPVLRFHCDDPGGIRRVGGGGGGGDREPGEEEGRRRRRSSVRRAA
jgi:hypothetical protein